MHIHLELCLIPVSGETSLSPAIARCQDILREAGLDPQLHAWGTNVEGDWDQVMAALKACHAAVHDMGAPRIVSSVKIGSRIDKVQSLRDKIDSVAQLTRS